MSHQSVKITSILLKFGWSSCVTNVIKALKSYKYFLDLIFGQFHHHFKSRLKDLGKNTKYFQVLALWCVKITFSKFMNFSLNFDQNSGPHFAKNCVSNISSSFSSLSCFYYHFKDNVNQLRRFSFRDSKLIQHFIKKNSYWLVKITKIWMKFLCGNGYKSSKEL